VVPFQVEHLQLGILLAENLNLLQIVVEQAAIQP